MANIKLDVEFVDYMRKTARKNRAGKHCYLYAPVDWDGHEVIMLKLAKKEKRGVGEKASEIHESADSEGDILSEIGL